MNLLVLIAIVSPVAVFISVIRHQERRSIARSTTVEVRVDDDGVTRLLADGREEQISWGEIMEVEVFAAKRGPHRLSGGAVVLHGDEVRGCLVPFDHLESSGLLAALPRLRGFDTALLIAGMEGTPHQMRSCWRRDDWG